MESYESKEMVEEVGVEERQYAERFIGNRTDGTRARSFWVPLEVASLI
jgi:hypothetical protein